jgi:hypothetical protein
VSVYYFDALADHNVAEDGEEREDGRKRGLSVDDQEGNIVDLQAICKVPYTSPTSVGMSDDNHLVAAIDEFLNLVRAVKNGSACRRTLESWYM